MKTPTRILAFAAALLAVSAFAQDWPSKPIRLVVPFAPGGVTDTSARAVAEALGQRLGQPVVVENKPGASGNIGTDLVARAAPDGYTLVLGFDGTMVINPHVFKEMPFDTLRDFTAVTKLGDAGLLLVAHPSLGVKNLSEFLALAKTKPGPYPYGTSGTGGTPHLAGELLKLRTGVALQHIPYKGGGQAMTDVLGGNIPLVFTAIASAQQHVKSGKVIALGVPSPKRSSALPDVPTFIEAGLDGFEAVSWVGIFAPAKTPKPIVDKLQREIAAALQTTAVRERYAVLGIDPVGNTPEQFTEQVKKDLARWGDVVRSAGIKTD